MRKNKSKQARDMIKKAAEENHEIKDSLKELQDLERQMAEAAEIILGNEQTQNEKDCFVGSAADKAMMALAREQAKHDPELAALLKELDESEKQIARLTDILGK